MWPWDHLAIGYLVVSLWRRSRNRRPPREAEALAVVVGTQLPDVIDKPLGWGTTVLPSGHSMAHSLAFAVPLSLAVYLLGRHVRHADVGASFGLAYFSHLPGDVLYPVFIGRSANVRFLFWPFVELPAYRTEALAGRVLELLAQFGTFLGTPRGVVFLSMEATLLLGTLVLWWRDGWPGSATLRRVVTPWHA